MNIQVELPEKKRKRKRKRTKKTPPPSFSLLPDEILVSCLARVSSSYYPTLSIVSKTFRSILSSADFKAARSHLGNTEQWLYVCLYDSTFHIHQWFRLFLNPNGTLPESVIKKKTIEHLLVPVIFNYSSNLPVKSTVAVGSDIYVIAGPVDYAPSSAVRVLDCCTHTWRDAPSMNIVRMNAMASLHDGKIYVIGGCLGVESCDEVFDIKAQTWERLPDPSGSELRNWYIPYRLEDIERKIHTGGGINMYAYYKKRQSKWEGCGGIERSECVMENVLYCYGDSNGRRGFFWYDIKFGWKNVKGLDLLRNRYDWNGSTTKLVSCGGKLLLIWQGCGNHSFDNDNKNIWGAQIVLEKRVGGGVWGKAEWVDVLYTVPRLRQKLLHCLAVSV